MGRWTPLILMAGGLAILLGTLLGISFPMGGQNTAQVPTGQQGSNSKTSRVLPANINVNSTASGTSSTINNKNNVAQNNPTSTTADSTTADNNQDATTTNDQTQTNDTSSKPIQALW
jgi:hypothetical protein